MLAVLLATITGLSFSLNSIDLFNSIEKVKFPVVQLNMDGNFLVGLIFLPLFLNIEMNNDPNPDSEHLHFTAMDIFLINASHCLVALAVLCFSFALKYGNGGTIQAISNCKTIVQTIIASFRLGQVPTAMQIGGLVVGFFGASIIIVMKNRTSK